MAVKGKGKQVATESPGPGSGGSSGSSRKRRKGSGDAGVGPSSSSASKRRRRAGVLQFVDDAAGVDEDYEEEEEEEVLESEEEASDPDDGFFTGGEHVQNLSHKRTERSHPLPFLVKEEELSGDELEEFIRNRYSNGVKYAADRNYSREDDDVFPMDGSLKEPTIWRVKCMVGRERQMAFCFMQKFVDLQKIGTKVPIITAFALDHIRGFVFVEAEKACDVTEACKGFCSVYASRINSVAAAEVPSLLSSRTKPFEISRGTWVRMKNGNYKGDLAQVVSEDDGRKRVMIKIIPRVDLHAISKKYGGAISLREAAVPAPRLISSQELEFFRPHIEMRRDRQTGEVFEVLDGLMFKDGFLYKRVALSSLIYWGIQPTETELLKFSSSAINRASADDLDWVSGMYGPKKKNLPAERDIQSSSSKMKSTKASNVKASTSTENYDDNDEFNLHDLVLFGRKDFGVIIAVEKDGFRILKGGPEGSAVTVRKQEIKKGCVDKMFTAVDHHKKIISINDTVNVLEGPFQGKQGVIKHLYMGILFIYNESESENCGFFCAQCGSCENVKKRKDLGNTENSDNPTPMFSQPAYEQNEHRDTERPYRSTREQLFSIGQMLRIRKGPLKGYLCRVVKIFRNDVTVKLDSLLKIVTVQAEFLSVPANRGDNSSGAPAVHFGSQDTSFFGSEADKTSWDTGLTSFGSDSWQPFSSSTIPVQNAGGDSEADPWCKKSSAESQSDPWGKKTDGDSDPWGTKAVPSADGVSDPWGKETVPSADGDSDPWGTKAVPSADGGSDPWGKETVPSADGDSDPWGKKTTSSAVGAWNTGATQKGSSSDSAWDKQAGFVGSDAAGSSWDGTTVNKESDKSDNWGEACRVVDMGTGGDADPWGSKVKAVNTEGTDSWGKVTMPPENKLAGVSQGWGQPLGKSNEDQGKDNISKDAGKNGAWDAALPATEDGTWGKSKDDNGDGAGGWNEAKSDKNGGSGGWDTSAASWNKSSATAEAQEEGWGKGNWNKPGASDQAGCGDWDKPKSFGGDGSSSWSKGEKTWGDDQNNSWSRPGNFGGGRGFGRGRGRGRGQESGDSDGRNDQGSWKSSWGGDNAGRPSWRSDSQVDNGAGDSGGYRGRGRGGRGQYGGRGRGRDNSWRGGDRSNSGFGRENDSVDGQQWGNSSSSDCDTGAANKGSWGGGDNWNATNPSNNEPWSSSGGTKSHGENKPSTWNSSEDNRQSVGVDNPWASKVASTEGKEQQNDTWASKMTSAGAEGNSGGWNAKGKDSCSDGGKEQETDPWASKVSSSVGSDGNNDSWNTTAKDPPSEDKADDPWNTKGGNDNIKKTDSWGAGSSGGNQESSWSKPIFSLGDQEPTWSKPSFGDDNGGNSRGGFGRGYRGRGRGRNFGDGGSGGERSEEPWNRMDFDGGRGRGRGRFGRGDRNQGNSYFGSGDGGSWGSGRGNGGRGGYKNWNDNNEQRSFGQGGGWSSDWNANKGSGEGQSKPSWEAQNTSGGDYQAGKSDANNSWSQNRSSPSILGQPSSDANKSSTWGATSGGGGGSWGKSNEDSWNSSGGGAGEKSSWGGGSEATPKKEGGDGGSSWGKSNADSWNSSGGGAGEKSSWGGGSEATPKKDGGGGGGSSWDKAADGAWNKGGEGSSSGW